MSDPQEVGGYNETVFPGHSRTAAYMNSLKPKQHFPRLAQTQNRPKSNMKRGSGDEVPLLVKELLGTDSCCWEREH